MKRSLSLSLLTASIAASISVGAFAATGLNDAQKKQTESDAASAHSQKKVSALAEKTQELLENYRTTLRKIENTKLYNQQVSKMIDSQNKEMVSIKKQTEDLKGINRDIVPLMSKMIATLESFTSLDMPFLQEERKKRVESLKVMMTRADVTTSEKYRRILEAYQVENEYGRTIEAYRGSKKIDGRDLSVDYLRVGRVALIYQSLDGEKSGQYDNRSKKWIDLDSDFKKSIQTALKVAKKQTAPNLLHLPVAKPEGVKL